MRRRIPSIAFAFLTLPLAALATFSACGGDDTKGDGGPDATTDVAPDIAKLDTGPDVTDASCANDVDLTAFLPSADASIDVDAGGFNIAECTGCLKGSCGNQINSCNNDCDCRQGVVDAVTCLANGGTISQCFTNALSSNNQDLINLIGCATGSCVSACIPSDGGTKGDAGTDAGDASGD